MRRGLWNILDGSDSEMLVVAFGGKAAMVGGMQMVDPTTTISTVSGMCMFQHSQQKLMFER